MPRGPRRRDAETVRFRTETGSLYELARDGKAMTWRRLSTRFASAALRTEEGRLLAWPAVVIGSPVELWSEALAAPSHGVGAAARLVQTSAVVAVASRDAPLEPSTSALPPGWPSFRDVAVGDQVTRILGGAPMELRVTGIDDRFIYCGEPGYGWKFDRDTGVEVDEEIGWGPDAVIGSYLLPAGATDGGWSGE